MESEIRHKIWYEIVHFKKGDEYLWRIIDSFKTRRKYLNLITISIATIGIVLAPLIEKLPLVSIGVLLFVEILKIVGTEFLPNDKELDQFEKLRIAYSSHFNKLERLWVDYQLDKINEYTAIERFYLLREEAIKIKEISGPLLIPQNHKSASIDSETSANKYITQYLNFNQNEQNK